jgi:uncharacterized protein (TIGR00725 family)
MSNTSKEKTLRILCSAEAFGYGPCSKLACIAKKIRAISPNTNIHFMGENSALDFAQQNSKLFNNIQEYDGTYPNHENYDLIISVMNPYLAIWGWFHRKKVIYIDSLFWFWKFEDHKFKQIENIIQELTSSESIDDVWAITKDVTGHHLHYIAHRLATSSCSQHFNDDNNKKTKDIFRKTLKYVNDIDPIIDLSYKKECQRDTILICLGGLLSPLNQKKEALAYVNLVLKIAGPFISEASKKFKIILTTNPEITKSIKDLPQDLTITSLSHEETLKTINRSVMVLTPAGITTMYECLLYGTPFFVLPELHDGHYPNYLRLIKTNKKFSKLSSTIKNALISTRVKNKFEKDPDNETRRIQSIIKRLNLSNSSLLRELQNSVTKLLKLINDDQAQRIASSQYSLVFGNQQESQKDIDDIILKTVQENNPPVIKKKRVIGIISSAIEITDNNTRKKMLSFGQKLGKLGFNIATGASIGIAETVGYGAKKTGSRLIGFSPSQNSLIHSRGIDNATINQFDSIHFNVKGFTARSLDFINSVDAVLMVSGRMGTLSEFTIAFEEGVPIFVLKGYGGISDKIEEIMSYTNKIGLTLPTICNNTNDLIKELSQSLSLKYYD